MGTYDPRGFFFAVWEFTLLLCSVDLAAYYVRGGRIEDGQEGGRLEKFREVIDCFCRRAYACAALKGEVEALNWAI